MEAKGSRAASQTVKRNRSPGGFHILHIPTPDYSSVMPKVNTWRLPQEVNGDHEVSGAMMSYVDHM
jgi:hypothetical protein